MQSVAFSTCPCCGQPAERRPDLVLDPLPFSPQERRVVDALVTRFGRFVSNDEIVDAIYADDPNGGPLWARHCLSKAVGRIREKLNGSGVVLENRRDASVCGSYRLAWDQSRKDAA